MSHSICAFKCDTISTGPIFSSCIETPHSPTLRTLLTGATLTPPRRRARRALKETICAFAGSSTHTVTSISGHASGARSEVSSAQ